MPTRAAPAPCNLLNGGLGASLPSPGGRESAGACGTPINDAADLAPRRPRGPEARTLSLRPGVWPVSPSVSRGCTEPDRAALGPRSPHRRQGSQGSEQQGQEGLGTRGQHPTAAKGSSGGDNGRGQRPHATHSEQDSRGNRQGPGGTRF